MLNPLRNINIKKWHTKTWLIIGGIIAVIIMFWWFQLRPAHVRSECENIAYLRAKASQALWTKYLTTTSTPTYTGYDSFIENDFKNDSGFVNSSYTNSDYRFEYERCLEQFGV